MYMEKVLICLVVGILLCLSPGSFVVGFTMAAMSGIVLAIYCFSDKAGTRPVKRDPSDIPLEEKGITYLVENGNRESMFYDSATVIRGVYKPGRIVTAIYHGKEIQCKVCNSGYGNYVDIDGNEFRMRFNKNY